MKQKRDNSPAVTVQVKYKRDTEYPQLQKNAKKAKADLSNYIRSQTLSVTCKCKE